MHSLQFTAPCGKLSNASQKMPVAMRGRRRYRLENKIVDKKYVAVRKIEKVVVVSGSRGLQKT